MAKEVMETEQAEEFKVKELEDEEDEEQQEEGWDDWQSEDETCADCLCLFCSSTFGSAEVLFEHCRSEHFFDFHHIVRELSLDFYGSFKVINYVRSQVAENKCWCCGLNFHRSQDLQNHLHPTSNYQKDGKYFWEDDFYLKPFMMDDPLLHSFSCDQDEEDKPSTIDQEDLMRELMNKEQLLSINGDIPLSEFVEDTEMVPNVEIKHNNLEEPRRDDAILKPLFEFVEDTEMVPNVEIKHNNLEERRRDDAILKPCSQKQNDKMFKASFDWVSAREVKNVNEKYFQAYGYFGIHHEMISDKVRMDAYREALLNNPSLIKQATVLDVGCGTGILSLFAAQGGASKVIAIEASEKMAAVATQVASDNGVLSEDSMKDDEKQTGKINVVHCMIEELDKYLYIEPNSVDVLVSEWMGYCLLYESMLSSVLYARDRWLKPDGAILPDTATLFGAGFGKGGTSLPFWEDVYGFNMSCIGKEVAENTSRIPVVDYIDSQEIMTESVFIQFFDLATMKVDDMDFTANIELKLRTDSPIDATAASCSCYGIVLWFDTGFTSRFCKEMPTNLSTSPYSPKTHWSQTILTFREPIAMTSSDTGISSNAAVGTEECPVVSIRSRISIVRSPHHRSIDISLEVLGISSDGRKRSWPVQIFSL